MNKYKSKRKKDKPDKYVKHSLYKLYASLTLMLIIVLFSSFDGDFSKSFRKFITHNLRYSTDFSALADKTVNFAQNCFNEYKNSGFDVFDFVGEESASK